MSRRPGSSTLLASGSLAAILVIAVLALWLLPETAVRILGGGGFALDGPAVLLYWIVAGAVGAGALTSLASGARLGDARALILAALAGGVWCSAASTLDLTSASVLWAAGWILASASMGQGSEPERLEAAVKTQGLGAAASLILLLACALLAGLSGSTHAMEAGLLIDSHPDSHVLALSALRVLVVGAALAAAWVPFHLWAPDGLGAAPRAAALVLAVAAPLAAALWLCRSLWGFEATLAVLHVNWRGGILAFAALTALAGGSVTLVQRDAARLTAYLTTVQCAEILPALSAGGGNAGPWTIAALAHALALTPVWLALAAWTETGGATDFDRLSGAGRRRPIAAFVWIAALSLAAGFPGGVRFLLRPEQARASENPWEWATLLALSGLLQWAAVVRLARVLFLDPAATSGEGHALPQTPVPWGHRLRSFLAWSLVVLALIAQGLALRKGVGFSLGPAWAGLFPGG